MRSGGPKEEPQDLALPVWAGVLPFALVPQAPVPDKGVVRGPPAYLVHYRRP